MNMTARGRMVSLSLALACASGCTNKPVDLGYDDVTRGTGAAHSVASGAGGAASASTAEAGRPGAGAGAQSQSGGSSGAIASQPDDAAAGAAGSSGGGTGGTGGDARGGNPTGGTGAGNGGDTGKGGSPGTGGSATGGSGGDTGKGGSTGTGGSATGGSTGGGVTGGSSGSGGAATGGGLGSGGTAGSGGDATGGSASITGPCDIYAAASPATPCVAAYSTTRLLYSQHGGPLYQVRAGGDRRGTGGTLQDIRTNADGFADAAAVDEFCGTSVCTVSILYDQSGHGNDLKVAPAGCYPGTASEPDYESSATKGARQVGGHKVYGLYMDPHEGYRNNDSTTMPTGTAAQGVYEVVDGRREDTGCCWEFGNASTDNCYGPGGETSAIFFGSDVWGETGDRRFFGDFGNGLWPDFSEWGCGAGDPCGLYPAIPTLYYAMGLLKTSTSGSGAQYALKVGNAQAGSLITVYDGSVRVTWQLGGGIILGIGNENSNSSQGTFFEGAITSGSPSNETDALVLENVQAAKYGQ
jgi:hypothetical protein